MNEAPDRGVPADAVTPDPPASPRPTARAFRAAAARMHGLDFVNPALEVEAVGFAPWEGHWLGVMVTPWFMNLTLLPRDVAAWRPLAPGAKRRYAFPAGEYEFVGASDPRSASTRSARCSRRCWNSPTRRRARLVATLARAALFDAAQRRATRRCRSRTCRRRRMTRRAVRSRSSSERSTPRCRSATSCAGASRAPTVTIEGELIVRLAWDGRRVNRVALRSTRPYAAARVLAGKRRRGRRHGAAAVHGLRPRAGRGRRGRRRRGAGRDAGTADRRRARARACCSKRCRRPCAAS